MTTGETRWTSQLGSVQSNFQFFQYLYQQKGNVNVFPANQLSYNANHRFRFYQVKGHLIVFQVGTQVYCLDADNGKILWQHPLIDQMPQQGPNTAMFIHQVLPDRRGQPGADSDQPVQRPADAGADRSRRRRAGLVRRPC